MARPFEELRRKMPPESVAAAEKRAEEIIRDLDRRYDCPTCHGAKSIARIMGSVTLYEPCPSCEPPTVVLCSSVKSE